MLAWSRKVKEIRRLFSHVYETIKLRNIGTRMSREEGRLQRSDVGENNLNLTNLNINCKIIHFPIEYCHSDDLPF